MSKSMDKEKFKAYCKSIGSPRIQRLNSNGTWGDSIHFLDVTWGVGNVFRIENDRHWELRQKWIESDFTLPIEESQSATDYIGEMWFTVIPNWYQDQDYRIEESKEELLSGLKNWEKTTLKKYYTGREEQDPGAHYRYEHKVNLNDQDKANGFVVVKLDPARIERVYNLNGMQFTMLKKTLRMGKGNKTKKQDLVDIISAAKRELELMEEDGE